MRIDKEIVQCNDVECSVRTKLITDPKEKEDDFETFSFSYCWECYSKKHNFLARIVHLKLTDLV